MLSLSVFTVSRRYTNCATDYTYAITMAYNGTGSQAGMLLSSTDADGNQPTYTYDDVGRRLTMVDAERHRGARAASDNLILSIWPR